MLCCLTLQIWVWLGRLLLLFTEPPNNLTLPVAKELPLDDLNVWNLSIYILEKFRASC